MVQLALLQVRWPGLNTLRVFDRHADGTSRVGCTRCRLARLDPGEQDLDGMQEMGAVEQGGLATT
jgi:hypothetical protein